MDTLKTLQTINACHGPAGDESSVADAIEKLAAPYADKIKRDVMGNLIVRKKGSGPKVMFAAHMDSIGFIVTHIDEKGFLRFGKVGGLRPNSCVHTPVRFKNGVRGVVSLDCGVEPKDMTLEDLYIDVGAKSREEAQGLVRIGDTAVFDGPAFAAGDRLVSPYMDDRIACVVLLKALETLGKSDNDLYFVFTVQEELGLRGAKTAAYGIDPDYGVAVDVTWSDDELNPRHRGSSTAGGGASIKVMDGSVICHPQMVKRLEELAVAREIPYQMDVIRQGGTDAGSIHLTRSGVYTGGVSIPCRYMHSPVEMVDARDVEACAGLVAAFAEAELE
ncbi:M20/M25/M40 family metallo-hydrolase [Pseudoflavonifractor sp. BIOML-A6]|nr:MULTISPECIES: M42 family metallopeptidase [unclassified Pseudoflavonifractor]MTQ97343.1 M20/M25/M40 family metallo-hydrolase [Pseudoflavonifractor sp. BIOML-A16]MTR06373.1 M20/M25/M40 family metallo-hydrolase [Pseudoflavonifractor sp. BIOML-A15]MTR31648.1 M20/M25/M40 family metallo-hydrolase [Pseudoflavonifractor sp. BIOML-A14]MTR72334.1 M20/M25/M40 family metallo-hydrolase [Pseudoflavonifractor sp. BIOML-A18]MTS64220.1 M20/M25/M40 family metallo-hydrolase [Pseudoflavonifractor sp. BIOML-A5